MFYNRQILYLVFYLYSLTYRFMNKSFKDFLAGFAKLNEEDWRTLEEKLKVRQVAKNEVLQEGGKPSREMFFVLDGALRSYTEKNGNEVTWNFYFPGGIATDFQSYLNGSASPFTFVAVDHSLVAHLNQSEIAEICQRRPALVSLEKLFAQRAFLDIRARMESFLMQTAEERYLSLIEKNAQLIQKLPNKDIATYLGIAPQSLSRIKARLFKHRS